MAILRLTFRTTPAHIIACGLWAWSDYYFSLTRPTTLSGMCQPTKAAYPSGFTEPIPAQILTPSAFFSFSWRGVRSQLVLQQDLQNASLVFFIVHRYICSHFKHLRMSFLQYCQSKYHLATQYPIYFIAIHFKQVPMYQVVLRYQVWELIG